MLLILFGLPGAGKNYVGRILAEDFGYHFHDGDDDLPTEMRTAIAQGQAATQAMRDAHTENIITHIAGLSADGADIAIAAAFFKERNRLQLLAQYPDARFVLVETTRDLLLERLARRTNHLADLAYAQKIFALFEPPQAHPYVTLRNVGNRAVVKRAMERVFAVLTTMR